MTTFETYTTKAGKTHQGFTSPFATNADAAAALIELDSYTSSEFAQSLIESFCHKKWGGENLSTGRAFWLHKLAMNEARPEPVASANVNVSRIVSMFASASEHLKKPKIVITQDGVSVKFYIAGERSRYHGQIMIVGDSYPGPYYGRIDSEGNIFDGKDMTDAVRDMVQAFAADPEAVAGAHGHATGNCCFCCRKLSDERSTAVGYGPKCAERYQLNWGTKIRNGATPKPKRNRRRAIEA